MNKRNKKKGFTLIEMIVVVAIIAILAGIAVPQVTKQVNNSKKNADIATAKVLAGAMQQYLAEGKTITDATKQEITISDPISTLSNYVDNANSILIPKMNSNYSFFYSYSSTDNTIEIYAGTTSKNYELYPTLDSNYK